MKKIINSKIFIFMLGIVVAGSVTKMVYALNAEDIDYGTSKVSDALNYLYSKVDDDLEVVYTNSTNSSIRDTSITLDNDINSVIIECYDNGNSYYVKLLKGKSVICGYHYLASNVWYENNRYLKFTSDGKIYIGWPRNINLSTGAITHPNDTMLYIKNIYKED